MNIEKLPKWAQDKIKNLERERDVAVRALQGARDSQKRSPFSYDTHDCTGEERGPTKSTFYIQTHTIDVRFRGVHLNITLRDNENGIDLQWCEDNCWSGDVACIPKSYQAIQLVAQENMRTRKRFNPTPNHEGKE